MEDQLPLDQLPVEERLILLICKAFLRVEDEQKILDIILSREIEWKVFLNKIFTHKLDQVTFFTFKRLKLGRHVPAFMKALSQRVNIRIQRSKMLYDEQIRVLEACKQHNLKVYPYKGAILSHTFYPAPVLRDSVDIDLAISEDDLEASMELMPKLGYSLFKENRVTNDVKKMRSYDIDFSWMLYDDNGNLKINTEFHWQPSHSVLWVPLTFKNIMDQTQEYQLYDQSVTSFALPMHTIIVLIHHGLVDGWGKVRHLIDFVMILKRLEQSEWDEFVALAKQYRLYNTLLVGLQIIKNSFGYEKYKLDCPNFVIKLAEEMAPKILKNELSANWSEQKIKVKYYLKMRDSWGDKARSLVRLVKFLYIEKRNKIGSK